MQQQHWQQQQKQDGNARFLWVMLLLASLAAITFYVIPFLASMGDGSAGNSFSDGWSASQQRQIALTLAQNVQRYRQSIHEQRCINYGDALLVTTGIKPPFRLQQTYEGMDSKSGAKNDTHSETRLKGWARNLIKTWFAHTVSNACDKNESL
jgi:hypothetical protein